MIDRDRDKEVLKAKIREIIAGSGCLSLPGFYVNKHCPLLEDFQDGMDVPKDDLATVVSSFAPGIDERSILCLYDVSVSSAAVPSVGELVLTAKVAALETGVVPYERVVITLDGVACRRRFGGCFESAIVVGVRWSLITSTTGHYNLLCDLLWPLCVAFSRDILRLVRHAFSKKTYTWTWNDIKSMNDGWPRGKLCINGVEIVPLNGQAKNILPLLQDLMQILRE